MISLLADGLFGLIVALWGGLATWFAWTYAKPNRGRRRMPQKLVLSAASLGWAAFILSERGWLPHQSVSALEAVAVVFGALAAVGVYLYEVEGPSRRP